MNGQMANGTVPVPGTQAFTVTLQAQEWNAVLSAMAKATYEQAAPLIQAIGAQLQEQAAASPPTPQDANLVHPH
jgi:hypothetical protein